MKTIEIMLISTFSLSLLMMLIGITFICGGCYYHKKVHTLEKSRRTKNKRKKRQLKEYQHNRRKFLIVGSISLFISLLSGSISGYLMYDQKMNLAKEDQKALVDGYYLIEDFEKELLSLEKEDIDEVKSIQNIQSLGNLMASYNEKKANPLTQNEGQQKINRYYKGIKELGINATNQSQEMITNKKMVDAYLVDIKKLEKYQKEIFKLYKVNEVELEKNN